MNMQEKETLLFEKISKIQENGKTTSSANLTDARTVLSAIFDDGNFVEIGSLVGSLGNYDGTVCAYGSVFGRTVYAWSEDATVNGGAFGKAQVEKILSLYEQAEKNGAPVISILSSNGSPVNEGISLLDGFGRLISAANTLRGVVPQIALINGTCAGTLSLLAAANDFVVGIKEKSALYLSPKSEGCAGVYTTKCDDLGGAVQTIRSILGHLPMNYLEGAPINDTNDDPNRVSAYLASATDADSIDAFNLVSDLADAGSLTPLYNGFDTDVACGFISMGGVSCGYIATNPLKINGLVSSCGCKKAANFINILDSFNVPVVTLINAKGFESGVKVSEAANLAAAYANAGCAKVSLVLGNAYGTLYTAFSSKALGTDVALATAGSVISVMEPETAVEFMWNKERAALDNPITDKGALIEKWENEEANALNAANIGLIDDVIRGSEARAKIIASLYMLSAKRRG